MVSTANGRYLVAGEVIQLSEVLKILHQRYPAALHLLEKYVSVAFSFHLVSFDINYASSLISLLLWQPNSVQIRNIQQI